MASTVRDTRVTLPRVGAGPKYYAEHGQPRGALKVPLTCIVSGAPVKARALVEARRALIK